MHTLENFDMKNFMTALGSSTCYMEQRSSDNIIANVNDDNIDKGQCHHFSIREYVRQRQMSNTTFCSLFDKHISSSLVTTKTYRQWNCKSCRDKLDLLYNRTPARTLNESPLVPEHAVHKELSQEKGSAKCHLPCSYNEESTELDRAINGTCGSLGEKLEFLPREPMVGRSEKGNSVKSLPVKRKDGTHANFHDINQNVIKTYKRRKNTNISSVDCQDRSESSRAGNSKEKHVTSITQADAGLLYPAVCLSEGKILYTTSIMDGGERFKNNGVQQIPCSSEKELECLKMHLSKVSPGKSEQTLRKTTEHKEDKCVIVSVKEASTRVQSEKSNPEFSQLEQQQSRRLHNEQALSTTEHEEDDCAIVSVAEFPSVQHQQFQHLHNEVSLGNATEDEGGDCVITSVNHVSASLQSGESHNQYNGENFTSYRDDANLNGSFPPTMDIPARYQHPENFCKPVCPVPRIGVLSLTLQKEVATYAKSCGTESGYRLGMYDEEAPCQIYRGESLAFSSSQQIPANYSPQHLGYATSVAIPEPVRESSHSTKGKSKMVDDPSDKSSEQDMCALSLSICPWP